MPNHRVRQLVSSRLPHRPASPLAAPVRAPLPAQRRAFASPSVDRLARAERLGHHIARLPALTAAPGRPVIQRARGPAAIFNFIDQNGAELGPVGGIELKRLLYWDDRGHFDAVDGRPFNLKAVRKAMTQKIPTETPTLRAAQPGWMKIRDPFALRLPAALGGGRLTFPKLASNVVFEGRGWIAENLYWRAPAVPRVQYLIHAIVEWAGGDFDAPPTPHITLRNADTQARIDLDTTNPVPVARVQGLEATRTSFSQGLGVDRDPGASMVQDDATFAILRSGEVQAWLGDLRDAAQAAVDPLLREEG